MESNEGVWNSATILTIDGNHLIPELTLYRGEADGTGWRVNNEDATEYEHDTLYYRLFGNPHERNFVLRHEINEDNIQEIIWGYAPSD